MPADAEVDRFLVEWHRVVAAKDVAGLGPLLAPGVSLGAPPYWQRLDGHAVVHHLLGLILESVEDFTYRREWREGADLALEFTGRVGRMQLQAIDLITLDAECRVARLDVLMRPIAGIEALRDVVAPRMTEFFARRAAPAAGGA